MNNHPKGWFFFVLYFLKTGSGTYSGNLSGECGRLSTEPPDKFSQGFQDPNIQNPLTDF